MLFMNLKGIQVTKEFLKGKWATYICCLFHLLGSPLEGGIVKPSNLPSATEELFDTAWDLIDTHEYQFALDKFEQARKRFQQEGNLEWVAYCNSGIAEIYEQKGDYDISYEYSQKAIALLKELNNLQGQAKATFCLGGVLHKLNRFQQSNDAYRFALQNVGVARFEATCFNNMGVNFRELGLLDSAAYCHHEAIKLNLRLKRPIRVAKALSNLGMISVKRGNYDQALEFYRQAEQLHTQGADTLSLFKLYNRFGAAYKETSNYEAALDYLLKGKLIDFHDPHEVMLNRELLLEVRLLQKNENLQKEINEVDKQAKENSKRLLIAFLLLTLLSGVVGVLYFRQQVINLNHELRHDDLVKQLHEAKLLFVQRCLGLIKPELDKVSDDVLSNNKVDAVLGLKQTQSIIDEIDTEITKN